MPDSVSARRSRLGSRTLPSALAALFAVSSGAAATAPPRSIEVSDHSLEARWEPASVATPRTRFVIGPDSEHAWDRSRVRAWRGTVSDRPDSHAFLIEAPSGRNGYVDLDGSRHWIVRNTPASNPRGVASPPPAVPSCGVADAPCDRCEHHAAASSIAARETTRVIELAVETDHELFQMAGGVDETLDYVVELYSAVSDIFERDLGVRLELTYVRIWDTPEDLFNQPEPLQPFRQYWNQNMGDVERDVAQFLSGRRDLPWGGIAYLNALCGGAAYSVAGYALGFIPDLDAPSIYHYDVPVCAHELGHNFGAQHTHSYGLDDCFNLSAPPQRGTIMSYCSQSVSGGNSVTDLRFHAFVQDRVREFLATIACDHRDCDGDGIDDAEEIASGLEADENQNGIPDVCEDCDGDGILDDEEIAAGEPDLDGNFVPDACDPDCNGNGVPDAVDIAEGTSADLHANGIPDECEADCDGNGLPDYAELMADMSLDLDRNRVLDICEDCDRDGVPDLIATDGAFDCWVATHDEDPRPRRFHSLVGTVTAIASGGAVVDGNDVRIDADGVVFVSGGAEDRIARFDRRGSFLGDMLGAGKAMIEPCGLEIGPVDGLLYVASRGTDSVLRFDRSTADFLDVFVQPGAGGLTMPFGLAFGPDGDLYVNGEDGAVRRFDGETGAFVETFVTIASNGGLGSPRGMAFKPDGNLLVASRLTGEVLEYDGATGSPLGRFNRGGTTVALTMDEPWGVRVGPNGNVFVVRHHVDLAGQASGLFDGDTGQLHVNASRIYEFDVDSGNFLRSYVTGHDTGLWAPTGFDFLPPSELDCNGNRVPDACDIASGRSEDADGDGVPDECGGPKIPEDLDQDGLVSGSDLAIMLANWLGSGTGDVDASGVVDGGDLARLLAAWTTAP